MSAGLTGIAVVSWKKSTEFLNLHANNRVLH
jgi:hypothetical protein